MDQDLFNRVQRVAGLRVYTHCGHSSPWASKAQTTQDARQLSQTLDMDTSTESYLSRNCVQPDEEMLLRTFANAVQ